MQKLKLLPWLARQHGIAIERAEELWRQAVALADFHDRESEPTSDYWAYAMRTLLKLVRTEGAAILEPAPVIDLEPPSRRPAVQLLASQHRLGTAAFDAAEAYLLAANDLWRQALAIAALTGATGLREARRRRISRRAHRPAPALRPSTAGW